MASPAAVTGESTSPDVAAVVEAVPESPSDVEAVAQGDEAEGESTSPEVQATEGEEPEEYRNFLAKYNGDKKQAAQHYWKTQQDNAKFARENKDLHEKLDRAEAARIASAVPKEPPPPPADIQRLDGRIGAIQQDYQESEKFSQALLVELSEVDREIAGHQAVQKLVDDASKPLMDAKIRAAESEKKRIISDYNRQIQTRKSMAYEINKLQDERHFTVQRINAEMARQEQSRQEVAVFQEEFPKQIDSMIEHYSSQLKVPSDLKEYVWDSVYDHLVNRASPYYQQKVPAGKLNWEGMIKDKVASIAKAMGLSSRATFAQVSAAKAGVTKPVAGATQARPASKSPAITTPGVTFDDVGPKLLAARNKLQKLGW